jgi:hypothetical protein
MLAVRNEQGEHDDQDNGNAQAIRPDFRLDRTVLRSAVRSTEDPRHVVRTLQRREVAGAWQGDPLNIR